MNGKVDKSSAQQQRTQNKAAQQQLPLFQQLGETCPEVVVMMTVNVVGAAAEDHEGGLAKSALAELGSTCRIRSLQRPVRCCRRSGEANSSDIVQRNWRDSWRCEDE